MRWPTTSYARINPGIECKYCHSKNLGRSGKIGKDNQRYICKDCKRTFVLHPWLDKRQKANLEPSKALFHLYGSYMGDGTLDHRSFMVRLGVTELAFRDSFFLDLQMLGLHTFKWTQQPQADHFGSRKPMHFACANSKTLYEWLLNEPEIPEEYYVDFLRGFYEAEGTNAVETSGQLKIYNSDYALLELIQRMLWGLGFANAIRPTRTGEINQKKWNLKSVKQTYELYLLNGKGSAIKFLKLINPCIKGLAS